MSNEKFKCGETLYVLQYYVPNKETSPEEYAHCMLFMYYPFRDEKELFSCSPPHIVQKLAEPGVIKVVNQSYYFVEPFAATVDDVFARISSDIDNNMDPYRQQENDEVNDNCIEHSDNLDTETFETTEAQAADLGNMFFFKIHFIYLLGAEQVLEDLT